MKFKMGELSKRELIIGDILSIITLSIVFGILVSNILLNIFAGLFSSIILLTLYFYCKDLFEIAIGGKCKC